jgi:hypothetical protein
MQKIMQQFETVKKAFNGSSQISYIQLPRPLNELHDPGRSIEHGEIRITE